MRVAVVGTHCSGKTTLIEKFLTAFPNFGHEQEPHYELSELGVVFSEPPEFDDFVQQSEFSIQTLVSRSSERNVIFDRCPLDLLAYLDVIGPASGRMVPSALVDDAKEAVRILDLIVFLPLSIPDEIHADAEYPKLRAKVDQRLKQILHDDEWMLFDGTGLVLVELRGSLAQRYEGLRRSLRL